MNILEGNDWNELSLNEKIDTVVFNVEHTNF